MQIFLTVPSSQSQNIELKNSKILLEQFKTVL